MAPKEDAPLRAVHLQECAKHQYAPRGNQPLTHENVAGQRAGGCMRVTNEARDAEERYLELLITLRCLSSRWPEKDQEVLRGIVEGKSARAIAKEQKCSLRLVTEVRQRVATYLQDCGRAFRD